MKFFHLSDLHIGKKVNGFSMIEDQKYIFDEIIKYIDKLKPNAVLIAGDVYDKTIPSIEAVNLFDEFISSLAKRNLTVIISSGNHDSPERLAFAAKLLKSNNIHISSVFNGRVEKVVLSDEYGEIDVYMLPYLKPIHVRKYFNDALIETYDDAIRTVVGSIDVDKTKRNIILAHQFIINGKISDSEEYSVGTIESISAKIFDDFDYVALGHLHGPQSIDRKTLRYSGSPLKYSFSEVNHKKSIASVDIFDKKADIIINKLPLVPIRDMVEIKGSYEKLMSKNYYENLNLGDYYHITLTDENDILNAVSKLRTVYKNIMKLDYDNTRTRSNGKIKSLKSIKEKSPIEIIDEFYNMQNNIKLNDEQIEFLNKSIDNIWSRKNETD